MIGDENFSSNGKLNNMEVGWRHAEGDYVIIADSNVLMPPDIINRMVDVMRNDAEVSLVCSPPIGVYSDNFWGDVECAFLNTFEAKWQLIADRLGMAFTQGKIMLVRKDELDSWGGMKPLSTEIGEDAAATKLVRTKDKKIKLLQPLIPQVIGDRTFKQVWNRQMRWAFLRKNSFPFMFFLEFFVTLVPTLYLAFLNWKLAIFLYMVGITSEYVIAKKMKWFCPWKLFVHIIVRDIMFTLLWGIAWFKSDVEWRGKDLCYDMKKRTLTSR